MNMIMTVNIYVGLEIDMQFDLDWDRLDPNHMDSMGGGGGCLPHNCVCKTVKFQNEWDLGLSQYAL